MKVIDLIRLLQGQPIEAEVRIGNQVEAGPYSHTSVGGVFQGRHGEVILCANDDEDWVDEFAAIDTDLNTLWSPANDTN